MAGKGLDSCGYSKPVVAYAEGKDDDGWASAGGLSRLLMTTVLRMPMFAAGDDSGRGPTTTDIRPQSATP